MSRLHRAGFAVLATAGIAAVVVIALPADAATAGVVSVAQTTVVDYNAADSRAHNVVFTRSGRTITVDDVVSVKAGTGCGAVSGDSTKVRCTLKVDPKWVRIALGGGNDTVVNQTDLPISAKGGAGNDRLTGGPGGDLLDGGAGNDALWGLGGNDSVTDPDGTNALSGGDGNDNVSAGWGNDRLYGGNGDDQLNGFEGNDVEDGGAGNDTFFQNLDPSHSDADAFIGGTGIDTVNYQFRDKAITADADAVKGDDGAAGEHDTIGATVEVLVGGNGNDRLLGTDRAETFYGGPGNDVIAGSGGNDVLYGQGGKDYLNGAGGNDTLVGDDGNNAIAADTLLGGPGEDLVSYEAATKGITVDLDGSASDDGQPGEHDTVGADVENVDGGGGSDRITGNAAANKINAWHGSDTVVGGGGDDTISVADGDGTDHVDGGANGTAAGDICQFDAGDVITNCEREAP